MKYLINFCLIFFLPLSHIISQDDRMAILSARDAIINMDNATIKYSSDSRWMAISNNTTRSEIYLIYEDGTWYGGSNASIRAGNIASISFGSFESKFSNLLNRYNKNHLYLNDVPSDLKTVVDLIRKVKVESGGGQIRILSDNDFNLLLIYQNPRKGSGQLITQRQEVIDVSFVEDDEFQVLSTPKKLGEFVKYLNTKIPIGSTIETLGQVGIIRSSPWRVFLFMSDQEAYFEDVSTVEKELAQRKLKTNLIRVNLSIEKNALDMIRLSVCKEAYWKKYTSIRPTLLFLK